MLKRVATLLKPHFSMGVFLKVCCIYSEHFLIGASPRAASAEQIQTGIKL